MPIKRDIDVRIHELEERLIKLRLEKEIDDLQAQMKSLKPVKKKGKRVVVKRAIQPPLPGVKKSAVKRKRV